MGFPGSKGNGLNRARPVTAERLEPRRLFTTTGAADFVIHVSVDGLRPDAVTDLGPAQVPNFYRLRDQGASTHNARTDYDYSITLPNHTSQVTGRPVVGELGHNWTTNTDPAAGQTLHANKGAYVPSAWDVAHDRGLRTGLYASKTKFSLYDTSYDADAAALQGGAPDAHPADGDQGRDKIDTYVYDGNSATLTDRFVAAMSADPFEYVMLHYHDPDTAGHGSGWMGGAYLDSIKAVDAQLGKVLNLVGGNAALAGRTTVILTADHGGSQNTHVDATDPLNYTIPFYVWGAGVTAGTNLYQLNAATRTDPGTGRPDHAARPQPIRDGDAANLALDLLDLPPATGSLLNAGQDLVVGPAGLPAGAAAVLAAPPDNGPADSDPAAGSVTVSAPQPNFQVRLTDADGVDDATVTAAALRMTRDGVAVTDYAFAYDAATDTATLTPASGASSFSYAVYEIYLNDTADQVRDTAGAPLDPTRLRVHVDGSGLQTATAAFRQGADGYAGAADTQLQQAAPTADNAANPALNVDVDDPFGTGHDVQALLRFGDVFGAGPGQVPAAADIRAARLELNVFNPGTAMRLHRMLRPWSDAATWDGWVAGVSADGAEANAAADATSPAAVTGAMSIDVTASLLAWQADPATNHGWVLLPTGDDGVDFDSAEGATRPRLVVEYAVNAPAANADTYATAEDTALTVAAPGVLANDTDADGDPLSAVPADLPAHGSLSLNADGSFTYTPDADFAGSDRFTYRAFGGGAASNLATVTINVAAAPDAPVAADDAYGVAEDAALAVAAPGVTANDADPDHADDPDHAHPLDATLLTGPARGALAFNADGSFVYTPDADFHGTDTFTYRVGDGTADSNPATVTITVAPVNDAPGFTGGVGQSVAEDAGPQGVPGWATAITAGPADESGQAVTFLVAADNPALFAAQPAVSPIGDLTYTPAPNASGTATVTVRLQDSGGTADGGADTSAAQTFTITVSPVADPTVTGDDAYAVTEGTPLVVAAPGVLANDADDDGAPLSAALTGAPGHGTLSLNADGSFTYTAAAGFTGTDSFTYAASDGGGGAAGTGVVTLTVSAAPPVYATAESTVHGTVGGNLTATRSDNDGYESIREAAYSGGRRNRLEHRWTFDLGAATGGTFNLQAHRGAAANENFLFQYSVDGTAWAPLVTVSGTGDVDQYATAQLPAQLGGRVYVRVVDANPAGDDRSSDTIYVDHMFIRQGGGGPVLPTVSVTASDPAAAESGEPGQFTVTRTGDTAAGLVVDYTVGGTATAGTDYAALAGTVTIPAGSAAAAFSVVPIEDAAAEGGETVVVTLSAPAGYDLGPDGPATVTIADNDASPTPPAAPTNLTAVAVFTDRIGLAWTDNASNEDGFRIERSTDGTNFSVIGSVGPGVTSFTDTGLRPWTNYHYRVVAFNAAGASAYSNVLKVRTKR